MQKYENDFFILNYNENDLYKDAIIGVLNTRTKPISEFFGIRQMDKKVQIKIYHSIEKFKDYLIPYLDDGQYYDWMMASTHDGNINVLSFECCQRTFSHKDITLKEYLDDIVHECVHSFHHALKGDNQTNNGWFHEALATNLSNQDFDECDIDCTLEELKENYGTVEKHYNISYTIGKYLLENYSREFILSLCKDENKLDEFAPKLFETVKSRNTFKK